MAFAHKKCPHCGKHDKLCRRKPHPADTVWCTCPPFQVRVVPKPPKY